VTNNAPLPDTPTVEDFSIVNLYVVIPHDQEHKIEVQIHKRFILVRALQGHNTIRSVAGGYFLIIMLLPSFGARSLFL
jgi:hypothetical protein